MCGIVGVYDLHNTGKLTGMNVRGDLEKMADKMYHRGPDSDGYYIQENLGFGFRRLAIIDLAGGNQPLFSTDGNLVLVCNGEIFNYIELRQEMIEKGYHFSSNVDVEVIIPLYQEYGPSFINKLNGQFAFALYDKVNDQLLMARDHVGICPLYYTIVDGILVFGSEIKTIIEHPLVEREVDLTGLDQIMTFPGLIAPRTMFKNIHTMEAGHRLLIKNGVVNNEEYWDVTYPQEGEIDYQKDEDYYIEKLDQLLDRAIDIRLRSDVPVGFYLSGGLDSSLVAAKIAELSPGNRRHSFSINFTDQAFDESKYQLMMADKVNSIHHVGAFDPDAIDQRLRKAVYHSEQPLKESYNTASEYLSELTANEKIRVVLSGEGADELLAGYVGYRFDEQRKHEEQAPGLETALENKVRDHLWGESRFIYEKDYHGFSKDKLALYSNGLRDQYQSFFCLNHPLVDKSKLKNRNTIHQRSYLDFKLRLSDHLIADHGDRMLMANSVEGRFPFLDKDVIDFIKTIPPHLKLKDNIEKYILKKVADKWLPQEILHREKFSFVAQGSDALVKKNREWINDILAYDTIKRQGVFDPDEIVRLTQQYAQPDFKLNLPFDNDFLIIVITFGLFLDEFGMTGV